MAGKCHRSRELLVRQEANRSYGTVLLSQHMHQVCRYFYVADAHLSYVPVGPGGGKTLIGGRLSIFSEPSLHFPTHAPVWHT